jgi:thiamine-phosphate pyrophosphorylase
MSEGSARASIAAGELAPRLRVVAITPADLPKERLVEAVRESVGVASGRATAVMLRHPGLADAVLVERGRIVAGLAEEFGFLFILNGPPEAAIKARARAVHLGSRTVGPQAARRIAGRDLIIGYSVHFPFEDHADAIAACDYITYSPVFPTTSKPGAHPLGIDELMRASRNLDLPVVALGGIGPRQAFDLGRAGCRCTAAISAVMGRFDGGRGAVALRSALEVGIAGEAFPGEEA